MRPTRRWSWCGPAGIIGVYRWDPLTCLFVNLKLPFAARTLILALLLLCPPLIVCAVGGTLISPTLATSDLATDLHVATHKIIYSYDYRSHSGTAFPFLRDYVFVLAMLVSAYHIACIQRQWERLSTAFRRFHEEHAYRDEITEADVARMESMIDVRFRSRRGNVAALILAALIMLVVLWSFQTSGMYSILNPGTGQSWEVHAGHGWWASPSRSPAGTCTFLLSWIVVLYYIFYHNIVGIMYVVGLLRVLAQFDGWRLFSVRPYHYDGVGGLGVAREALSGVFVTIALAGFTVILGVLYISESALIVMFPFFALLLFVDQFYVWVPLRKFGTILEENRAEGLASLYNRIYAIRSSAAVQVWQSGSRNPASPVLANAIDKLDYLEGEYRRYRAMPTSLFSWRRILSTFFLLAIQLAGVVIGLISLYKK